MVSAPAGPSAVFLTLVVGFLPELAQPEATSTVANTATAIATARIPTCIRHRSASCHASLPKVVAGARGEGYDVNNSEPFVLAGDDFLAGLDACPALFRSRRSNHRV
jgi:hypothetical protein